MAFNRELAKGYAVRAKTALVNIPTLQLAYPAGDPDTESACKEMQTQLAVIGVPLELKGVSPLDIERRIVDNHNFDLVYRRHQYRDETYWLWPLVDPECTQPGGSNFMGYQPAIPLAELFQQILFHKQFAKIQDLTHKVHEHVFRTATVIPLWQLDVYVAVSDRVTGTLDPVDLFSELALSQRTDHHGRAAEVGDAFGFDEAHGLAGIGLAQADVTAAGRGHGPRETPAVAVEKG